MRAQCGRVQCSERLQHTCLMHPQLLGHLLGEPGSLPASWLAGWLLSWRRQLKREHYGSVRSLVSGATGC